MSKQLTHEDYKLIADAIRSYEAEHEIDNALHFIAEGNYSQMPPRAVAYISRCINVNEQAVRRAWNLYRIVQNGILARK
jgi:hypothetical protein